MKRIALLGLAAACSLAAATIVSAKPVTYQLPDETAAFKPGPNLDVVQGNCGSCHSSDYVLTQPQGPKFKKDFWEAEVTKMIKAFGAPISEADGKEIADYLTRNYGQP